MKKQTLVVSAVVVLLIAALLGASSRGVGISPFGVTINGRRVLGGTVYVDTIRAAATTLELYDVAGADGVVVQAGGNVSITDDDLTNVGDIALDTVSADNGTSFSISDNWTNAGNTVADLGSITTVDINAGTMDGISSLTSSGDLDIGAHDLRAATITADGLTSGRVVVASTAGVLSDDTDLTFAVDTLTVTKLGAWEATGAINFDSENMTNVDVDSGAIDGTAIGATSATTGKFTTVDVDTDVTFNSQARILGPRLKWTYVATDTILTQADSGSWWGTFIATAGAIFTLPTDGSNMAGVNFCFYNTEGYTVTIDPSQGASIIRRLTDHTGANERVQSTAEHDVLCLVAGNNDVQWYPYAVYGTWADID